MNIIGIPRAVLRMQYRIARAPLQLLEERVVARLDAEAPARVFYERSFGAVDAAVGKILGDGELAKRGGALARRGAELAEAARLDAVVGAKKKQAHDDLNAQRDAAGSAAKDAIDTTVQEIDDARAQSDEQKQEAVRTAAKRTTAAKGHADEAAARKTDKVEATTSEEVKRVTAAEESATAVADAELRDAADKRSTATAKRAHADQVEELADAEREARREARSPGQP